MKSQENKSAFNLQYTPELDGLRGIAIGLVLLIHSYIPYTSGGHIGVDIFFVLSGFLITSILLKEKHASGKINLKHFYIRRFLRLLPALITLLVAFNILNFLMMEGEGRKENMIESVYALTYTLNWARAFHLHPTHLLGHTWSLGIEEQFYLIWPILLFFLSKRIKDVRLLALCALALAGISYGLRVGFTYSGVHIYRIYNGTDTRLDALFAGATLAFLFSGGLLQTLMKWKLQKVITVLSYLAIPVVFYILITSNPFDENYFYFWSVVVIMIVLIWITNIYLNKGSLFNRILSMKWLVWVGSISYGLYLYHYPIFARITHVTNYDYRVNLYLGLPLAFVITVFSYYFIEKPFLRRKTRFAHKVKSDSEN